MNDPTIMRDQSLITNQIHILNKQLDELSEILGVLYVRLEPILNSTQSTILADDNVAPAEEMDVHSPMARALIDVKKRLSLLIEQLTSINDRADL